MLIVAVLDGENSGSVLGAAGVACWPIVDKSASIEEVEPAGTVERVGEDELKCT
jgi:hypothetical protein